MASNVKFEPEKYLEPEKWEESPLLDRKRDFPTRGMTEQQKAEFIRDFLSLANMAALRGEVAHLLWGIADNGETVGIEEFLATYGDDNPKDAARQALRTLIERFVDPHHRETEIVFGEVTNLPVAYLRIGPDVTGQERPFCVAKDLCQGEPRGVRKGESWIRSGESKLKLEPRLLTSEDPTYGFDWRTVPHLLPAMWKAYLTALLDDDEMSRCAHLASYLPPISESGEALEDCLTRFLAGSRRLLVVEGAAASGKSTWLLRSAAQLAQDRLYAVNVTIETEGYGAPSGWIPVVLRLRTMKRQDIESLDRKIVESLQNYATQQGLPLWKEKRPTNPEQILNYRDLQWVLFLDGVDELRRPGQADDFVKSLCTLLEAYPRLRVVATVRSDALPTDWCPQSQKVRIAPLDLDRITTFLRSSMPADAPVESRQRLKTVEEFLRVNSDLTEMLSAVSYVSAVAQALLPDVHTEPLDANTLPDVGQAIHATTPPDLEMLDEEDVDVPSVAFEPILQDASELLQAKDALDVDVPSVLFEPETEDASELIEGKGAQDEVTLPISKAVVLQRLYDYLWQREIRRQLVGFEDAQAIRKGVGDLALDTDGRLPRFDLEVVCKRIKKRSGRDWLLQLGVLRFEDQMQRFSFPLSKYYFAAERTRAIAEGRSPATANKRLSACQPEFRAEVLSLYTQIAYQPLQEENM